MCGTLAHRLRTAAVADIEDVEELAEVESAAGSVVIGVDIVTSILGLKTTPFICGKGEEEQKDKRAWDTC